eukprot:CAMPEP_0179109302 /NCGR_PEP_ID=MMETSP0796-20121207/50958_1 /TAXON_ID=73915 /ORGANISM="Pyrodinium bahamense, Strain pbaha01" /LENGTH=353 /DNA_ID=CAMNT_0020807405 /DNA_START=54 /DNA_END=1115 /DNA_ORIENTATION=-
MAEHCATSFERQGEGLLRRSVAKLPQNASLGSKSTGMTSLETVETDSRHDSKSSVPSSHNLFADRAQSLLFLDWDETLFPTTDLVENWGITINSNQPIPRACEDQLREWRAALMEFLEQACALSELCVIVTNSQRPWVEQCAERFVPELLPLLKQGRLKVVYANEKVRNTEKRRTQLLKVRPVRHTSHDIWDAEVADSLTMAKYAAMKDETERFYSKYKGQSWKNIISMGDMHYERLALQEVTFRRQGPPKERVRTKTMVLPTSPSLSELALRLQFLQITLLAHVRFNGDFDMDLGIASDPLQAISDALQMPELGTLSFSRHAWGLAPPPSDRAEVNSMLEDLAIAVQNMLFE